MKCQQCGKQIRKGSVTCKFCGTEIKAEQAPINPQRVAMTDKQKATLAAIRRFEVKKGSRLRKPGAFSKKYGNLLMKTDGPVPKAKADAEKKVIPKLRKISIPIDVPLNLPLDVMSAIREGRGGHISLEKLKKGKSLRVSYTTASGDVREIGASEGRSFTGHQPISINRTLPFVGLGVTNQDGFSKLDVLIPSTPAALTCRATRNQGEALYLKSRAGGKTRSHDENAATQENGLKSMLSDLITPGSTSNLFGLSQERIENVAWHDFASHEYLRDPEVFDLLGQSPTHLQITPGLIDLLDSIDDPSAEVIEFMSFLDQMYQKVKRLLTLNIWYLANTWGNWYAMTAYWANIDLLREAYWAALLESGVLSDLYEMYFSLNLGYRERFPEMGSMNYFYHLNMDYIIDSGWDVSDPPLRQLILEWFTVRGQIADYYDSIISGGMQVERINEAVEEEIMHPFDMFVPGSWNLGLRLVYRQEWRPLGIQRGETIKTIPLGPKQVEKVSTRIFRRSKVSRTAESLTILERTTETADTSKDSSEIITEAAESSKWNAGGEAGLNLGFFKIGGGGGGSGASEEKSKTTSTHLTETMQKTASRLRTETKIVVSTESESTFEATTASEIQNPNDEIAITYVFSKLQRQYEILTRLAEVNSVVFIAEQIPLAHEVTREWVRKHDWVIAKVLLDDSFRGALASITQEISVDDMPTEKIDSMMEAAMANLSTLANKAGNASLENIDVIREAQRAYRESYKENLEKKKNRALLERKQQRLLQHIRKNILHYCRAIWSQEDPEQRMLRYKKLDIRIPTIWRYIIEREEDIPISGWSVSGLPPGIKGHFEPVLDDIGTIRSVTELINPAGPIGFAGNYAIYHLKADAEIDCENRDNLFDVLHLVKSTYMDLQTGELIDPTIRAMMNPESSAYVPFPDSIPRPVRKKMAEYVPQIRVVYEGLDDDAKEGFLGDGLLPDEREEYNGIQNPVEQDMFFNENSRFADRSLFYEYLFRKEYSRRFLVDTNNLILDLETGTGSALETFKKLHRYVDVMKTIEEQTKMEKENQRRQKLIDEDKLGDPEIEKVTIITGDSSQLASVVARTNGGSDDNGDS